MSAGRGDRGGGGAPVMRGGGRDVGSARGGGG